MWKALIYKPSRNVMQSGMGNTSQWVLELEQSGFNYQENCCGSSATKGNLGQVKIKFKTLDEAIDFSQKKGYCYRVLKEKTRKYAVKHLGPK